MTIFAGPFLSGGGASFSEGEWRELFSALAFDGVVRGALNQFAVTAGTGMNVNVDTGHAIGNGVYVRNDASVAVTLNASDPTNDRIDLLVIHINLTGSVDGAGVAARSADIIALAGTPAGSPTAPSYTLNSSTWEIPLAQVRVPHGAVSSASFIISMDNVPNVGSGRSWSGARVVGQSMSVFSGITGGSNPTTVNHGLGETPNYILLTANNTGTPAKLSFHNQNATTVDIYSDTPGAQFVGLAIRQVNAQ